MRVWGEAEIGNFAKGIPPRAARFAVFEDRPRGSVAALSRGEAVLPGG